LALEGGSQSTYPCPSDVCFISSSYFILFAFFLFFPLFLFTCFPASFSMGREGRVEVGLFLLFLSATSCLALAMYSLLNNLLGKS